MAWTRKLSVMGMAFAALLTTDPVARGEQQLASARGSGIVRLAGEEIKSLVQGDVFAGPAESQSDDFECGCGEADCGICEADACCEDSCPQWSARMGVVALHRDSPDPVPMVYDDGGVGPLAFAGDRFDLGYSPGVEVALRRAPDDCHYGLEGRYLWVDNWTNERRVFGLNNAAVNTTPRTAFGGVDLNAYYQSSLQSAEANLQKCLTDRVTVLAGARYIRFHEKMLLQFAGAADDVYFKTGNELVGMQIGTEALLFEDCKGFRIDAMVKAGVYGNFSSTDTQTVIVDPTPVRNSTSTKTHVAFFGEAGIFGSWDFNSCWSIRSGYRVLFLDGVLVAGNQTPMTDNLAQTLGWDYSGVLFHGGSLSIERRW